MKKIYRVLCFMLLPLAGLSQAGTWALKTHAPTFRTLNAVQLLPGGRIVAVGGHFSNDPITSLYYSDDSATTWTIVTDQVNAMMNALHFPTGAIGYTAGNAGKLFKSVDAGQSWLPLTLTGSAASRSYNGIYFTDANTGIAVGGNRKNDSIQTIIRTTDGGQNWSVISDNLGSWLLDVTFADANNGYAVGAMGKILKTVDGGLNWTTVTVPAGLATRQFRDAYFFNALTGIVVGGYPSNDSIQTIIKTTDGGLTWNILSDNLSPMLNAVHFYSSSEGYVTGDQGVVKYTNDQGSTWTSVTIAGNDAGALNDVFFLNSNLGIASGEFGKTLVYKYLPLDAPTATITTPIGIINSNTAYVQGMVNANGIPTTVEFEYGTSLSFGTLIPMSPSNTTNNNQAVTLSLTGLLSTDIYYGRIKVVNASGIAYSSTAMFSTNTSAIPNFDFELWNSFSTESLADWMTVGDITKVLSYDGSYAAHEQGNGDGPGGVLYANVGGSGINPLPYAGRPDSIIVYAKYDVEIGDSAMIFISFSNGGNTISSDTRKLGGNSGGLFQRIGIKINYTDSSIPDAISLLMLSTDYFEGHNSTVSTLSIDNVVLTGGVPQLPNSNMEHWTIADRHKAVSWWSRDDTSWRPGDSTTVTRSTDAYTGSYALLLRNDVDNQQFGFITTGNGYGPPSPDFPVSFRHANLNGYYKFEQDDNDTLFMNVNMYNAGTQMGYGSFRVTTTVSDYEAFSIPITYYGAPGLTPDSSQVSFSIRKGSGSGGTPGASMALIDDLTFDGLIQSVSTDDLSNTVSYSIFPNPTNNNLSVLLKNIDLQPGKTVTINITDLTGRIVKTEVTEMKELLQIDVSSLAPQLYLLNISTEENSFNTKFIKN